MPYSGSRPEPSIYPEEGGGNPIREILKKSDDSKGRKHHATKSIGSLARRFEEWKGIDLDGQRDAEEYAIQLQHAV
jgi:hypothetical protein